MDQIIVRGIPETLWNFAGSACHISAETLQSMPGDTLPEPARQLLVHQRDMTSTLSAFHGSSLRVDVLQQRRIDGLYLREVFLRTHAADAIVEYGVIAIALEQFTPAQQDAIQAGQVPLGSLLHRFEIEFDSSPVCFFSIPANTGAQTPLAALKGATCFGRFNRLATPAGAPLAWIMEILPPATQ
jgi:chorismate-pyruvate lyase